MLPQPAVNLHGLPSHKSFGDLAGTHFLFHPTFSLAWCGRPSCFAWTDISSLSLLTTKPRAQELHTGQHPALPLFYCLTILHSADASSFPLISLAGIASLDGPPSLPAGLGSSASFPTTLGYLFTFCLAHLQRCGDYIRDFRPLLRLRYRGAFSSGQRVIVHCCPLTTTVAVSVAVSADSGHSHILASICLGWLRSPLLAFCDHSSTANPAMTRSRSTTPSRRAGNKPAPLKSSTNSSKADRSQASKPGPASTTTIAGLSTRSPSPMTVQPPRQPLGASAASQHASTLSPMDTTGVSSTSTTIATTPPPGHHHAGPSPSSNSTPRARGSSQEFSIANDLTAFPPLPSRDTTPRTANPPAMIEAASVTVAILTSPQPYPKLEPHPFPRTSFLRLLCAPQPPCRLSLVLSHHPKLGSVLPIMAPPARRTPCCRMPHPLLPLTEAYYLSMSKPPFLTNRYPQSKTN